MIRYCIVVGVAATGLLVALSAGEAPPAEGAPELPLRFAANVMAVSGPATGTARVRFTIERWTTDEERGTFLRALESGGVDGLVAAMDKVTVGYLQVNDNLRYPIRVASSWPTSRGRSYRLATNRAIEFAEFQGGYRSIDYPIGFVEFSMPAQGTGEGQLLAATKVRFNEQRQLEVTSLPQNTGPQKLMNIRQEKVKPPKPKKSGKAKPEAPPQP